MNKTLCQEEHTTCEIVQENAKLQSQIDEVKKIIKSSKIYWIDEETDDEMYGYSLDTYDIEIILSKLEEVGK